MSTINGTNSADLLNGTANADLINGLGGNDTLNGLGGNDTLDGGNGIDSLDGGIGDDLLIGAAGNDTLNGGDGSDTADYRAATAGIRVDLGTGRTPAAVAGVPTGVGNDFLISIENAIGSNFDDIFVANSAINTFTGRGGNDTYILNNSNDVVVELAGEGIDTVQSSVTYTLSANVENLTLTGTGDINGTGNDLDNLIIGNNGNNIFDGGEGTDTIDYTTATAGVFVNLNNGQVTGGGGNDTIVPNGDSPEGGLGLTVENVIGSAFDDTLRGDTNEAALFFNELTGGTNNKLEGGAGNDLIEGGFGNDTLSGGAGNDTLEGENLPGGEGFDFVDYSQDPAGVTVDLPSDTAIDGYGNTDTLINIYNVIGSNSADSIIGDINDNIFLAGDGNDTLEGRGGVDFLEGGAGDDDLFGGLDTDTLKGDAGNDTLNGGDDLDTADYSEDMAGVTIDLSSGTATDGFGDTDTLINIEGVAGTAFADSLTGTDLGNVLIGNAGDDFIDGLAEKDTLRPGEGNDTVFGGAGDDTFEIGSDGVSFGDVLDGGDGADKLVNIGNNPADPLNPSDPLLNALRIANWDANNSIETIDAKSGFAQAILGFEDGALVDNVLDFSATSLLNVAYIDAGAGNDVIIGASGDSDLRGGDGNDTLSGGSGKSTLDGGAGDDSLTGGDSDNTLIGGDGNDILVGAGGGINILEGSAGNDTLFGGAGDNTLDGGIGNDSLVGGDSKDVLIAGEGIDTVLGGGGDDTIVVGDEGLVSGEIFNGGDGVDTLVNGGAGPLSIVAWDATNSIESIDALDAGGLAQAIVGDATANVLDFSATQLVNVTYIDGGAGNDTITGATLGINEIRGDGGNDLLIGGNEGNLLDGGIGADILIGGDKDDTLLGSNGNDNLNGGLGKDSLDGGAGADTLLGGAEEDILLGDAGNDSLDGGDGKDILEGGIGADTLLGGAEEDELFGGDGNDRLLGGDGKDFLVGGAGADTLTGGADLDTFIFEGAFGADRIVDFQDGIDFIDLKSFAIAFDSLTIGSSGAGGVNTLITSSAFGEGNTITLLNFSSVNVDATDFLF
jgi:Ca2+-binding RTX toxin-like protein